MNLMVGLFVVVMIGVTGCGGSGGSDGGSGGTTASGSYFPSIVGYSWTYDITPSTGTPYSSVSTVTSSSTSGFSVKSQNSNTTSYGQTDYNYDGTALKYSYNYSFNTDDSLSSITEYTPAALVLPSNMAVNTTESTTSTYSTASITGVAYSASLTRSITVNGEESVTTPAGTFTGTKITLNITTTPASGTATVQTITYWYVKNIGRVKSVSTNTTGTATYTTTSVLRSYSQTSASSTGSTGNNTPISTYSISGQVILSGVGLSGVTVSTTRGTSTTDSNGYYTISGLTNGTYSVSGLKAGYTTSASQSVTINNGNVSGINITATEIPTTYSLQGDWYYNKGSQLYMFDRVSFVPAAVSGNTQGNFTGIGFGGTQSNYVYDIDDTGKSFMLIKDLGNGTGSLSRTYNFIVTGNMLTLQVSNMTGYFCKGSANGCSPP
jgi:hypothetical protein